MRARVIGSVLWLWGCASTGAVPATSRGGARFVVLDPTTTLRTRPAADAPSLSLPAQIPLALRRVREANGWIELETVAEPARHCAGTVTPPEGVRLRVFAPSTAAWTVLARPLRWEDPDASLTLQPGLVVQGREVTHGGLRVTLGPAPAVARTYRDPGGVARPESAERLSPGTRLRFGDGTRVEVTHDDPVYVLTQRPSRDGVRVTVATRCVAFERVVPSRRVLPVMDLELSASSEQVSSRWSARSGAPLTWPDGSPAGRTVREVALPGYARDIGPRRCFMLPLQVGPLPGEPRAARIEVCAAATDLRDRAP